MVLTTYSILCIIEVRCRKSKYERNEKFCHVFHQTVPNTKPVSRCANVPTTSTYIEIDPGSICITSIYNIYVCMCVVNVQIQGGSSSMFTLIFSIKNLFKYSDF